ncbi:MAG TPA: oxidoreductase [Nocardioidaceae bacterium]|nr:oxidoreductase [Nocardioidaceae bacterium]
MPWTPKDLPDLTGTVAVVTGANSGIGFHTARELAAHGADVVLACRNIDAGERAAKEVGGRLEKLDLASQKDIEAFADRWEGPVDLLINNAGLMRVPEWRPTEDGHELQFGTNHLGHFALTGRLLPHLLKAKNPRVVTVASLAHHAGTKSVVEGNPKDGYEAHAAYGNTKLANILFALELQRRAEAAGSNLVSNAAHPGIAVTNLVPNRDGMGANPFYRFVAPTIMRVMFQSAKAGADPTLYAAAVAGPGSYSGPQGKNERGGKAGPAKLRRLAQDEHLAKDLWEVSEKLTGVSYCW